MTTPTVLLLAAVIGLAATAAATAPSAAPPAAPRWDEKFMFFASAAQGADKEHIASVMSTQVFYDWSIPAWSQVNTNNVGATYTILNVGTNTWRVNTGNGTCCLCTDPYSCGHVTPASPDWLQTGNTTVYVPPVDMGGVQCEGWVKSADVAVFGWWTRVGTHEPCQLSWLLGTTANMSISFYRAAPSEALLPKSVFDVPKFCKAVVTDPNCGISHF